MNSDHEVHKWRQEDSLGSDCRSPKKTGLGGGLGLYLGVGWEVRGAWILGKVLMDQI